MDIKHLNYFVAVIESNFNLTRAAELLYISQPTLSVMVNDFEKEQGVQLFTRKGQRINGLTLIGERFLNDTREVLAKYYDMMEHLHEDSHSVAGEIKIGIPPLVLSVLFSKVMPQLMLETPDVKFDIIEKGADALTNDLLTSEVDIAVLLHRHNIPNFMLESVEIEKSELAVFMSEKNSLADSEELVSWEDLGRQRMAIFSDTFMIHHLVKDQFKRRNIIPNIAITSISWDFLVNSIRLNDELISIMPLPIMKDIKLDGIVVKKIKEPIPWSVNLCRVKKVNRSQLENIIFEKLVHAFEAKLQPK